MSTDPGPGTSRVATGRAPGTDGIGTDGATTYAADGHTAPGGPPYAGPSSPPATSDIRHDRIRWGAVWTGTLTTLAIYVVLQLLFNALGWLDLGVTGSGSTATRAVVSGVLALIAFFLGGMAAGASALWQRAGDGMVNAVVSWALTVAVLLLFTLIGGGILAGVIGNFAGSTTGAGAVGFARTAAGSAALALGLSALASAGGGAIGAKIWPGRGNRAADRR